MRDSSVSGRPADAGRDLDRVRHTTPPVRVRRLWSGLSVRGHQPEADAAWQRHDHDGLRRRVGQRDGDADGLSSRAVLDGKHEPVRDGRRRTDPRGRAGSRVDAVRIAGRGAGRLDRSRTPDGLRRTNRALRFALFIFGTIVVVGVVRILDRRHSICRLDSAVAWTAMVAGVACFIVAQFLVSQFQLYRFGVEEAFAVWSVALVALRGRLPDVVRRHVRRPAMLGRFRDRGHCERDRLSGGLGTCMPRSPQWPAPHSRLFFSVCR